MTPVCLPHQEKPGLKFMIWLYAKILQDCKQIKH